MITIVEFKRVLERFQVSPPVKVIGLANELGIKVYKVEGWSEQISGRIFRSLEKGGDSGFAIEVNADHSNTRQRFTVAHEIAHFVLHEPDIGYGTGLYDDALYRSGLSNHKEVQANRWASRILMPDHLIQEAIGRYGTDIAKLASVFDVSPQAMAIRLGVPQ